MARLILIFAIAMLLVACPVSSASEVEYEHDVYAHVPSSLEHRRIAQRVSACMRGGIPGPAVFIPVQWYLAGSIDAETLMGMARNVHVVRYYSCIIQRTQTPV